MLVVLALAGSIEHMTWNTRKDWKMLMKRVLIKTESKADLSPNSGVIEVDVIVEVEVTEEEEEGEVVIEVAELKEVVIEAGVAEVAAEAAEEVAEVTQVIEVKEVPAKAHPEEEHLNLRVANTAKRHVEAVERKVVITEKEEKAVDDK